MKRMNMFGTKWDCRRDPSCPCLCVPPDLREGALSLSACPCGSALTVYYILYIIYNILYIIYYVIYYILYII